MTKTMVPDPDCRRCDGVGWGWYEGGECIQTYCKCRRIANKIEAEEKLLRGSEKDWKDFYNSLPDCT